MNEVRIYIKPNCPQCPIVKNYLKNNSINFTEFGLEEALEKGYRSFPTVTYGDMLVVGLDLKKLKELKDTYNGTV